MAGSLPTSPIFDDAFRAQLHQLFVWRRDVRHFRSEPLPDGTLESLTRRDRVPCQGARSFGFRKRRTGVAGAWPKDRLGP